MLRVALLLIDGRGTKWRILIGYFVFEYACHLVFRTDSITFSTDICGSTQFILNTVLSTQSSTVTKFSSNSQILEHYYNGLEGSDIEHGLYKRRVVTTVPATDEKSHRLDGVCDGAQII